MSSITTPLGKQPQYNIPRPDYTVWWMCSCGQLSFDHPGKYPLFPSDNTSEWRITSARITKGSPCTAVLRLPVSVLPLSRPKTVSFQCRRHLPTPPAEREMEGVGHGGVNGRGGVDCTISRCYHAVGIRTSVFIQSESERRQARSVNRHGRAAQQEKAEGDGGSPAASTPTMLPWFLRGI